MYTIEHPILAAVLTTLLSVIVIILIIYCIRHIVFTINRLLGEQRHPYIDIDVAQWPMITVFIAAHNEEKVIAGCIEALLNTNYPSEKLKIIPVNDRSTDATGKIMDQYVRQYPSRITPFHRTGGQAGKAAALKGRSILQRVILPSFLMPITFPEKDYSSNSSHHFSIQK